MQCAELKNDIGITLESSMCQSCKVVVKKVALGHVRADDLGQVSHSTR